MADHSLPLYPLALLELMSAQQGNPQVPPLGIAKRVGVENSAFTVAAHSLLKALIQYSPSPIAVAQEFLVELGKCGIEVVKQSVDALTSSRSIGPGDWAAIVYQEIRTHGGNLSYLTDLGTHYWSHLIITFRNPGGKKTPQETIHPSPDRARIEDFEALIQRATLQSQSALRELVFHRDGYSCLISHLPFADDGAVIARCAHIIPFSIHSKAQSHRAIETFTGYILKAEVIQQYINRPCNALNLQNDVHNSMDMHLAWGIEAQFCNNQWKYYFRVVRRKCIPAFVRFKDGDEILFGRGESGNKIELPNPHICNLHLAIARVSAASGAAEVFDKYLDDDDHVMDVPIYFGSPFVSDDALMRKLEVLASCS